MTQVYKWEVLKLLAQKRTYLGLGVAMLVPLIFTFVLIFKTGGPNDIPLGRYIRETGLALPFVVLFFMSIWANRPSAFLAKSRQPSTSPTTTPLDLQWIVLMMTSFSRAD